MEGLGSVDMYTVPLFNNLLPFFGVKAAYTYLLTSSDSVINSISINFRYFYDLCCKLAKIALFAQMMEYWVECMTSSVISFAYFTHFSNLNISGTNAGICKR